MNARLTDRDLRLLVKCAICRWLTTGQIQRLYFPKASLNAVQKRLRKLSDAGYLRSYREHPTVRKGRSWLRGRRFELWLYVCSRGLLRTGWDVFRKCL